MGKTESNTDEKTSRLDQVSVFAETFANFNSTIKSLNDSYAALQERHQKLADELSDTNQRLRAALAENDRNKKFLENILKSLTSGVLTIDLQGRITSINRAGCKILKVKLQDVVGLDYHSLLAGGLAERRPLTGLLDDGQPYQNVEKAVKVGSGEIPISVSSSLITDSEGRAVGALEVFVDLTELREMEEEIARVKSLAALGEVAAVVAHEVRNPLSGIGGFATLLKRELGENHPNLEYVEKIIAGVDKLDRCVSSLLDYARELPLNSLTGDLRRFLADTVDFFKVELASRRCATAVELVLPAKPVRCCFDSEQLSRALINLLQNAQQAVSNGGKIQVALNKGGGHCRITVSDNGEGVPEDIRDKIFTPFFTTREGGTGLGLALVKKIAEAHRGKVCLQTNDISGSKFVIEIPDGS